jgi:hypothetical protein
MRVRGRASQEPSVDAVSGVKRSHLIPRRRVTAILVAWIFFIYAMGQWPGWQIANHVEPRIAGLPFIFVWTTAWWGALLATMIVAAWKVWR